MILGLSAGPWQDSVRAAPEIHLEEQAWDFGDLPRDSLADYGLRIANLGDEPLELANVRSSCACLLIAFEPATLGTGEWTEVPLRYVPDRRKGEIAKTVFIDSNDPERPRIRFTVKGYVLEARAGEVRAEPNPCFLEAAPGRTAEQTFVLKNVGQGGLELKSVRGIGCRVDPLAEESVAPGDSLPFRVRLVPDQAWAFNYFVRVETDDPTEPLLIIPVYPLLEEESTAETALRALGSSPGDTVSAVFFASMDCPHCLALKTFYLPRVVEFFEGRFALRVAYIDREVNYTWLVDLERRLEDTGNDIPALAVGREILGGHDEILERLPAALEAVFAEGGGPYPERAVVPTAAPRAARGDTIYLAYFQKPGCKECDRAGYLLRRLAKHFAPVETRTFDLSRPEDQELNEALCCAYGVPQRRRLVAPSLFAGGHYLIDDALDDASAEKMLEDLSTSPAPPPWEEAGDLRAEARRSIVARFQSLGPFTVVLGGLVDGVNPCAFATIIFFVSYLAFAGRAGREILWIGFSFTSAVFLTYLAVGLGALTFLQSLSVFRLVSHVVYGATAALAVGLGVYSLLDFVKIRRGQIREVSLQLPGFLKRRIHKEIRERARTRRYVLAAFITGAIVSLLELACTGQVYLPTICFVTGIPELRAHAVGYLVLYNLMFVIPLVAVFLVSYCGTTSDQLARFFQAHLASVRLATALFFFALAGVLISVLA